MNWSLVALILCSVAALGWACCTPDQWEGKQSQVSAYAGRFRHGIVREFNDVAYDYENKRSAVFMKFFDRGEETNVKIVVRYDDDNEGGMLYVDSFKKGSCWMKKLGGEFRKACIPESVKPSPEFSLGLKGKYNAVSYDIKGKRMNTIVTVQPVDEGICAPLGELSTGRVKNIDVLRNVRFVNITPGIKNQTVFDIPKDCKYDWIDFDLPMEIHRQDFILGV